MHPLPIFLDIEASSLGSRSYPIEVAWNTPDGAIEAHLISPATIARWTDWSAVAVQLHGISRGVLHRGGKASSWVGRRLNQQLAGHVVYSDDPEYDGMWLAELFAVSYGPGPSFEVRSADELLIGLLCPDGGRVAGWERLTALKKSARQAVGGQHRAVWDVQYLVTLYTMVQASARH